VRTLIHQIENPEDNAPSQGSLACPLVPWESITTPAGRGSITLSPATTTRARKSGRDVAGPAGGVGSSGNRAARGGRQYRVL